MKGDIKRLCEIERRLEPRIALPPVPVYMLVADEVIFYGYTGNISRSGMLVMSYLVCEAGREYDFSLALPVKHGLSGEMRQVEEEIPITFSSSIRWCRNSVAAVEGPNRHGLKIIAAPGDSAEHIEIWIEKQLMN